MPWRRQCGSAQQQIATFAGCQLYPQMVIQRQLGHSNLGITSVYLQGIDNAENIDTVHGRPARR
jgi:hypothetical protein